MSLLLLQNSTRLVTASLDRHLKFHDLNTFETVHTIPFPSPILSAGVSVRFVFFKRKEISIRILKGDNTRQNINLFSSPMMDLSVLVCPMVWSNFYIEKCLRALPRGKPNVSVRSHHIDTFSTLILTPLQMTLLSKRTSR